MMQTFLFAIAVFATTIMAYDLTESVRTRVEVRHGIAKVLAVTLAWTCFYLYQNLPT